MFIKRDLLIVMVALLAAAFFAGCSAVMKDSGGDQTTATDVQEQIDQVLGCACHTQYGQFLQSRHADGNNSPNRAGSCVPCHTGFDEIGQYITPEAKYFVDCASCHEPDGTKHGAINAGFRQAATSTAGELFNTCTFCHDFNPDEEYGAHHYVAENRYWDNADGDSARDANEDVEPSVADTTIASVAFSVWSLPASSDLSWGGAYAGPYYNVPDRTIRDSHFDEVWILNEADKATQYTATYAKLGYVNLDNNSPTSGMVNASDDENACLASCHNPHTFDNTIQNQWANGAHHPRPVGPIVDDGGDPFPSGPVNWGAVEHDFGAECLRCHSASGFAELDGAFGDAVATSNAFGEAGAFITCNACHDGENYPTKFNLRLRLNGDAVIFDNGGASVILTIDDAGPSATCIYCHQGRQNGQYIKDNYATALSTSSFGSANSHYVAAGGIMWTTVGYEYGSSPSQYANVSYYAHDMIGIGDEEGTGNSGPCVTCHMSGEPANHSFYPILEDENGEDILPEVCSNCHTGAHPLSAAEVEEESEGYNDALEIIADELEADGVFYLSSYPYFFDTSAGGFSNAFAAWTSEEQLGAAFNLNLLSNEPGAFAHNRFYAKRLVFDSIDWLDNGTLDGTIGDYALTHPSGADWLGTSRP